jgi:hypothetical protein
MTVRKGWVRLAPKMEYRKGWVRLARPPAQRYMALCRTAGRLYAGWNCGEGAKHRPYFFQMLTRVDVREAVSDK